MPFDHIIRSQTESNAAAALMCILDTRASCSVPTTSYRYYRFLIQTRVFGKPRLVDFFQVPSFWIAASCFTVGTTSFIYLLFRKNLLLVAVEEKRFVFLLQLTVSSPSS
jgi:hypothetical protein